MHIKLPTSTATVLVYEWHLPELLNALRLMLDAHLRVGVPIVAALTHSRTPNSTTGIAHLQSLRRATIAENIATTENNDAQCEHD